MTWIERKPTQTDIPNAELSSLLTSNKQTFRAAVERYSFWTDSSGVSAGIPRFSATSAGPGGFRAFFDVESNTSSALTSVKALSGRLYLTSDTGILYGYGSTSTLSSTATILLGGYNAVVYTDNSFTTIGTRQRVLTQQGVASCASGSVTTIAFPSAYSAAPVVQLTAYTSAIANLYNVSLKTSGTTNFSVLPIAVWGTASPLTVVWRSHGSVAL